MKLPRFSVHPFAAAGIFLLLFAAPKEQSLSVIIVTVLHETGHGTAALLLGKRIEKITLMPVGISMKISAASSYAEEALIAFAGPLENIFIILCAQYFPCAENIRLFSEITLAVNMLPMATLDGGRIISSAASFLLGEGAGEKIVEFTTAVSLFFLWILAVYIFFYTAENAALLIFCSYLFAGYLLQKNNRNG